MANYLTRKRLQVLEDQEKELTEKLAECARLIKDALEEGGTHDNATYDSALREQAILNQKLKKIQEYLKNPVVIDS